MSINKLKLEKYIVKNFDSLKELSIDDIKKFNLKMLNEELESGKLTAFDYNIGETIRTGGNEDVERLIIKRELGIEDDSDDELSPDVEVILKNLKSIDMEDGLDKYDYGINNLKSLKDNGTLDVDTGKKGMNSGESSNKDDENKGDENSNNSSENKGIDIGEYKRKGINVIKTPEIEFTFYDEPTYFDSVNDSSTKTPKTQSTLDKTPIPESDKPKSKKLNKVVIIVIVVIASIIFIMSIASVFIYRRSRAKNKMMNELPSSGGSFNIF